MTQNQQILKHLNRGWKITPLQALNKYGCLRLAARIKELKELGHKITKKMVSRNGKTFAEYRMEPDLKIVEGGVNDG